MSDYHLSLHPLGKVKTNQPHASQICIGVNKEAVAVRRSDLLWRKQNLDSRCCLQVFLRSLRCVSRIKNWLKLEVPAGKCTRTKPKVGIKICLIRHFREFCSFQIKYRKCCFQTKTVKLAAKIGNKIGSAILSVQVRNMNVHK